MATIGNVNIFPRQKNLVTCLNIINKSRSGQTTHSVWVPISNQAGRFVYGRSIKAGAATNADKFTPQINGSPLDVNGANSRVGVRIPISKQSGRQLYSGNAISRLVGDKEEVTAEVDGIAIYFQITHHLAWIRVPRERLAGLQVKGS